MDDYDVETVIQNILNGKETWTIHEKIPLLVNELDNLKADMTMFLENCDYDIPAILDEATELCKESTELVEEMKACKVEIEQETMAEILKSIENHDKIAKELEKVDFASNIVSDVVHCGNYIHILSEGKEAQSYTRAVESVHELLNLTDNPTDGFNQLELFSQTKSISQLIFDRLSQDLNQEWDRMVSYLVEAGTRKTDITVNINSGSPKTCLDVLNALFITEKLTEKIAEFSIFMLKEVFMKVVKNESIVYIDSNELTVMINHSKSNARPHYSDTIANMRLIFNFMNTNFNIEFAPGRNLLGMFGKLISIDFSNLMVNECFIHTIPNNINDLQLYARVTSAIEDFEHYLIRLRVLPPEGLSLLSYMENIDVLFANRSSEHFLETARSIMLKDLSVTMSIGLEKIPEDTTGSDQTLGLDKKSNIDNLTDEALDIFEKTIPKSLFYFPRCLISKTTQELLDLVYVIMEQAVQCSDVVCKTFYQAVRFIFELYDAVVPYHHENYLHTIPQYVALFHNNCMYLAHNLQTLGDKWLSLMEGRELNYAIGFVDLVQKIRELGYKHLTIHMQQQRKQILDNIRSSDLNCIVVNELGDNAEAAVRQCVRQLQLLKNVWIGVFPANVFTKLMATLVNMFVDELIHRVCTVEHISIEMATQYTDMYTLVIQKAPHLFSNRTDVEKYVKSWNKLQELIFVLGGSLKDIENHWKDGTGPLAVHFEVEELRSLIKALFQNTQFRANLLSKIK